MGFWFVASIVAAVVAGGLSYKAARDAQKAAKKAADKMAGVLVNKESNIEAIPVIYGERRVGGTRIFVHTEGGKKNEYLYLCIVLCEGEVESITDIEIDNRPITDARYSGLYSVQTFTGSDTQGVSTLLSATSKWGTNHTLNGIAYLAIRLKWDDKAFSGIPDITALVKGKKVYDPRSPSSPPAWSDNPALCIRDYLTSLRYGKGLSSSEIDDPSFLAAANDIEAFTVTEYTGGPSGIQLFKTNAVVDTDDPIFENLERMLICCKGFLPYQGGKYGLYIDQSSSSVMTLTTSEIVGGISIESEKKKDKFNRVICKFPNPETDWQPDQAIWPDQGSTEETTFLLEDFGEVLVDEVDLEYITNYYAARDFARIFCLRSRNALRAAFTATSEALNLRVGDVVAITHPTPGWTAKPFQVEQVALKYDGTVDLQCVEYDSTVYAYDPANQEATYSDTDRPDPLDVAPPTSFTATTDFELAADGSAIPYIELNWVAADDALVNKYVIQVRPGGFEPYEVIIATPKVDGTDATTYLIQPALVANYTIEIRSENVVGVRSTVGPDQTATVNVTGDFTAPSAPTWASTPTFSGVKSIGLAWTNPTEDDFAFTKIQRSPNGSTGWVTISNEYGRPGDSDTFVDTGLADSSQYYYRLYAYDWSANDSVSAGTRSGTTLAAPLDTTDLEPREVHGYVYYQTAQASSPSTPSASAYDYGAAPNVNPFTGLTSGWGINPPTPSTNTSNTGDPFWVSRFYVSENTYNGTTTVQFSTPFQSTIFDGLVTFRNLNDELGSVSGSLVTQIDGGHIKTGLIDLGNDAGMALRQGKTGYGSNTNGFWIGNNGTAALPDPRLNIGDTDNYLKWDGSDLVTSGIKVLDNNGEVILDAGGGGLGVEGGSIIRNGAFRDESKSSLVYLTNTSSAEIIDGWETADSSSGSTNTSYWGTQGVFQFSSNHTVRTQNRFPVEFAETLYLAVNNFTPSGSTRAWSIQVQYQDANGNFVSQTDIAYNSASWGDTAPAAGTRQISQAVVIVPNNNSIKTCRIRIRGGSGSSYVNIWNVYLGRSPSQITQETIDTYIRDLSVDTLKIQDNAVTIPIGRSNVNVSDWVTWSGTNADDATGTQWGTVANTGTVTSSGTLAAIPFSWGTNAAPEAINVFGFANFLGQSGSAGKTIRIRAIMSTSSTFSSPTQLQITGGSVRTDYSMTLSLNVTIDVSTAGLNANTNYYFAIQMHGNDQGGSGPTPWKIGSNGITVLGAKK